MKFALLWWPNRTKQTVVCGSEPSSDIKLLSERKDKTVVEINLLR